MVEFAELCAKTNFSLLEGASRPEEMIQAAKALGLHTLAVADRNGFYGSVRAHEAAHKIAQRYIVGAELSVSSEKGKKAPSSRVVFLVENHDGYRNLCRLVTRMKLRAKKGEGAATPEDLAQRFRELYEAQ